MNGAKTLAGCLGWGLVWLAWGPGANGEDVVTVQNQTGRGESRVTGDIVDIGGGKLVLRHASGREESWPAERVLRIEFAHSESHRRADELFANGDAAAGEQYRQALAAETRPWVKRWIAADGLDALHAAGQVAAAGRLFGQLYREDPATPHLRVIPLQWQTTATPAAVQSAAVAWLKDDGNAALRLIAASWLVAAPQRADAVAELQRLRVGDDRRLAGLAETQLWRTELAAADLPTVERWQAAVARLPAESRGGPCFLVGQALARHQRHPQAAVMFAKAALLYPFPRPLVPPSLLAAAKELRAAEIPDEARTLAGEVLARQVFDQAAVAAAREFLQAP